MKLLLTTLMIGYFLHCNVIAKIKNGYFPAIKVAEKCIQNLEYIGSGNLSPEKRDFLQTRMKIAEQKLKRLKQLHHKTEKLIDALNTIHPILFLQIDNIKDKEENITDVYIKAVDVSFFKGKFWGITNLNQSKDNPHVYTSAYGDKTVCVSVVYKFLEQALAFLVHELGHVKYQVPNLADYVNYFNKTYNDTYFGYKKIKKGHAPMDPSHMSVRQTEKEFYKILIAYKKSQKENKNITENKENHKQRISYQ
ncbi:hypothetical protein [Flexithrix dorotheae]|uniref:hypothetical protein n=1 Tax=Flexithrix dorotheae TaxID=70993 RepID=UPI0003A7F5BB|nr:hypothetical protein [Flexithrix dorotheae]